MKILFVSRWFPFPPDNGSKKRIYHLIKALSENHTVDLISFKTKENTQPFSNQQIRSICRRVDTILYKPYNPLTLKAIAGFLSDKPRFLIDTYQPDMASLVASAHHTEKYDLVIGTEIDMVPYIQPLKNTIRLYEDIEIGTYADRLTKQNGIPGIIRNKMTWWKLTNYLNRLVNSSAKMTTVSQKEYQYLTGISSAFINVKIIPNGVDLSVESIGAVPNPDQLIFTGALSYQANYDAVSYFLSDIYPLILAKRPDTKFLVTGSLNGVDVNLLPERSGVVYTGYLQDVSTSIAQSCVSVVPIRIGAGTRIKILESLGIGTPVVTTSKGLEGLKLVPEQDILVADTPDIFAEKVLKVMDDQILRNNLAQAGYKQVQDIYDWKKIGAEFCLFVEQLAHQPSTTHKPDLYPVSN